MTESPHPSWLPPLVHLEDFGGDWALYEAEIYARFVSDFVESQPYWPGKRVGLKRHPLSEGKEATFWHFVSNGSIEEDRLPDMRRCERIRWPRPVMEAYPGRDPVPSDAIRWWKVLRGSEDRFLLALPDFSYVVVVADRGDYLLPWTQYPVERDHQRLKLRRAYEEYWMSRAANHAP